jgi:hypothetical protein
MMRCKGFTMNKNSLWTQIITSEDANEVTSRFFASSADPTLTNRPASSKLLNYILRAESLSATSLQVLLKYIWANYACDPTTSVPRHPRTEVDVHAALLMIIRLFRHARNVWPNALEEIALLATKLIRTETQDLSKIGRTRVQYLSQVFNRLLSVLAIPTRLRPFQSVAIQQRSQFCIIRKMTTFSPHLPVTREGFRALVQIQLAHKKTEAERDWAMLKALSWPPWKEERLGIDADSEDAGKKSRAVEVLSRLTEAGYSHSHWEQAARTLAGWDTDDSPTIQTRKFLMPPLASENVNQEAVLSVSEQEEERIWAARILATRTVREAWACFTSYEKACTGRHTIDPYSAMFARLLYTGNPVVADDGENRHILPGDGKETWPGSTSPHDFTYVPSEPPSITEFFEMMTSKGIRPSRPLLVDLLKATNTLSEGMNYLKWSKLRPPQKHVLLGDISKDTSYIRGVLKTLPDDVLAAYIGLLCRVESIPNVIFNLPRPRVGTVPTSKEAFTKAPFNFALVLVAVARPRYRPTWYALINGLSQRVLASHSHSGTRHRSWLELQRLLREMDEQDLQLDFGIFQDIGIILEEAIHSNSNIFRLNASQDAATESQQKGASRSLCKILFHSIAHGGSPRSRKEIGRTPGWLPIDRPQSDHRTPLIDVPIPSVLHQTIRILGAGQESESILTLLRWMHVFSAELASSANELANSKRIMRRAMAAVRYFLEATWKDPDFESRAVARGQYQPGQKEALGNAKTIIQQHADDWGGWPNDEDLYTYYQVNLRKASRLRAAVTME